jgi:hypothetical protein
MGDVRKDDEHSSNSVNDTWLGIYVLHWHSSRREAKYFGSFLKIVIVTLSYVGTVQVFYGG